MKQIYKISNVLAPEDKMEIKINLVRREESVKALSEKLGITTTYLYYLLNGQRAISKEKIDFLVDHGYLTLTDEERQLVESLPEGSRERENTL